MVRFVILLEACKTDASQARKRHPFLRHYIHDWPIREYLKWHFSNQRGYRRRRVRMSNAKASQHIHRDAETPQRSRKDLYAPVNLGKRVKNINDINDFGSGSSDNDE